MNAPIGRHPPTARKWRWWPETAPSRYPLGGGPLSRCHPPALVGDGPQPTRSGTHGPHRPPHPEATRSTARKSPSPASPAECLPRHRRALHPSPAPTSQWSLPVPCRRSSPACWQSWKRSKDKRKPIRLPFKKAAQCSHWVVRRSVAEVSRPSAMAEGLSLPGGGSGPPTHVFRRSFRRGRCPHRPRRFTTAPLDDRP